jgi:hypothetical protein
MRKRWAVLLVGGVLSGLVGLGLKQRAAQTPATVVAATSARRTPTPRPQQLGELAQMVFDGQLQSGWQDLGWGAHDLSGDVAKVRFEGFGGIILQHAPLPWTFGGVLFRYQAPASWGSFLTVALRAEPGEASLPAVPVQPRHLVTLPGGWQEAFIGFEELNPERKSFVGMVISAQRAVGSDWVVLDKIGLAKPPAELPPLVAASRRTLRVRCDAPTHPIDPRIYGAANNDWSSGQTARRLGGNTYSRMNFDLAAWNTGNDWFFENHSGESVYTQIETDAGQGRHTALVLPMIGFVAKDDRSVGFPRSKFGPQRKYDPQRAEAGDGYSLAGDKLKPLPPTQTSIPAPPELIRGWVQKLRDADRARGNRAVDLYILDNEPSLWNETHRDVRPEPLGYDELLDRTVRYAAAVKEADPEALIAGPAEWGWTNYFYSAIDRSAGTTLRPDRRAHGDVPLIPWYLRSLAEYEKKAGKRLLDVLDVHFYPMASGVRGDAEKVDPEGAALRLRSTRALWDASYRDESWINDTVELIPRLKRWVAEYYPGTKVAIGEWSFGGDGHISGGLATAEALGRFGQHGLDAAYHWGGLRAGTPTYSAFRAFRNFDGKGGRFLDLSLRTDDAPDVSFFASADQARKHLVLIVLNQNPETTIQASIDLSTCGRVTSSRMFSYDSRSSELRQVNPNDAAGPRATDEVGANTPNTAHSALSPYSLTVLDLTIEPKP